MSEALNTVRSRAELDEEMENAFRMGDIGATALLAWEVLARFPDDNFAARLYVKKLLRDPKVASEDLDAFKRDAKLLREQGDSEELAKLSALGLLRFPAQRYLSLNLVDAAEKLNRPEWIPHAIKPLGEPEEDDIVLLNAVASLAQTEGDYERANELFGKLLKKEPDNETLAKNYSASLVGIGAFEQATQLLETKLAITDSPRDYLFRLAPLYHRAGLSVSGKLEELDAQFFASCQNANKARTHADVRLFLQDFDGVYDGLTKLLSFSPEPEIAFELAELELASNRMEAGLLRYKTRFEAYPVLRWFEQDIPTYEGQVLENGERVFVWAEQGIGDEVMFSLFLEELDRRVQNVTLATDPRLIHVLSQRYPHWQFLNRHEFPEEPMQADFACPMGDLMILLLRDLMDSAQPIRRPAFDPDPDRLSKIRALLKDKTRPRIAISWRGGKGVNGRIRSMPLSQLMSPLADSAEVDIISLQYGQDHEQEVREHADRRVALSGLDNLGDLEGVFSLLRCCDAVITVDNSVAHFAAVMGIPTAVLVPAGQIQFRWKNDAMRRLLFPSTELFVQKTPGDWSEPLESAWARVLDIINVR